MQGFNMGRYIPPSALDAGLTNANVASGKGHALGSRARKLNQGILTVRFEMPFAVWCTSCPQPTIIGQGVRFNAEKKKVGNYHSSPIFSFRMKHNACGGWLEIRTDPKNAEYVVHEGGKRRDYGEDRDDGKLGPLGEIVTEEERERRRNDAFATFEGKVEEKEKGRVEGERVEELLEDRMRHWRDPYASNQRLRKSFRVERKVRHRNEQQKEAVRDRLGLNLELLDYSEADHEAAKLTVFGTGAEEDISHSTSARPFFSKDQQASTKAALGRKPKGPATASSATVKALASLQDKLKNNTMATIDPFGTSAASASPSIAKRLKSVRPVNEHEEAGDRKTSAGSVDRPNPTEVPIGPLVAYDSD